MNRSRERLRTLGRIVAGLAHDLNNVLGAALAALDARPSDEANDETRLELNRGARLLRVIANHVAASPRERERIPLAELAQDAAELLGPYLRQSEVELALAVEAEPVARVARADAVEVVVQALLYCVGTRGEARRIELGVRRDDADGRPLGVVTLRVEGPAAADAALARLVSTPERGLTGIAAELGDAGLVEALVALHVDGGRVAVGHDGRVRCIDVGWPTARSAS